MLHRSDAQDAFTLPGARPSYAPDLRIEPVHIAVDLAFDLAAKSAHGTVTQTVRARTAGARSVTLDAVDFLDVAVHDPDGGALAWRYDGRRIVLTWDAQLAPGEERRVAVSYRVREPVSGLLFSWPDEAYPDRPRFVCSDHETERARYWLPCVDYPAARTTFEFRLTAPTGLAIVAGGLRVSESANPDGTQTALWRLEEPCPSYLACLAIGEFQACPDGDVDGREIVYWGLPPFGPDDLLRSFGRTAEMMRWMQQRLGIAFPYPKYHQIAVPAIGGAMENITLVTWDQAAVLDEGLASERGERIDAVNLHEMAHSYFGDSVVIRHFEHAWLKESWAVYMETVWFEETAGRVRRDWDLDQNARQYFQETERYVRPIVTRTYDSSWRLFDMHTYPGGAWRLHMLRGAVGDEVFWAATRTYLEAFAGRTAETDDFRRALEEHSGRNLVRFFDHWIYAPGHPHLKAGLTVEREEQRALLVVEQTQEDEKRGVGLFPFPLEVLWEDADGRHTTTLAVCERRHELVLPVAGDLRRVELDPECAVLFELEFDPGLDLLTASLASEHLKPRLHAVRTLAASGERTKIAALDAALTAEPYWGVRAAAAEALGRSKAAAAVEPLAGRIAAESDPRAQETVVAAAGQIRDPRLGAALRAFLDADAPPRARAAAFEALGGQRDPQDEERLLAGTDEQSVHEIVRAGALRGLAELRSERALDHLLERARYGAEPEASRPALPGALARAAALLGRTAEDRAAERLTDLLRDPDGRVRTAAAKGLADLGRSEAIAGLEALRALQPAQDGPAIDRWIARIRKGREGQQAASLRKEIGELRDGLRKLAERVDGLEAGRAPAVDSP